MDSDNSNSSAAYFVKEFVFKKPKKKGHLGEFKRLFSFSN
jgi:hypothetical protein